MAKRKKHKVIWVPTAEEDLIEIIEFISADNPSAARNIFQRIQTKARASESLSVRGRVVPELRNLGVYVYHELIVKPWRIIYKTDKEKIFVMAVLDSRRELQTVLLERLIR